MAPSAKRLLLAAGLALAAVAATAVLAYRSGAFRAGGLGPLPNGLSARDLNLVLLTLDTTRADRLGCYGHSEIATPRLDALAARGALFEQAHASAPLTLPSHASIFTGKYPPAHGVRDNGGYFLGASEVTLAERLSEAGMSTGGFVSAYVLDRRWGIAQGFDEYFDDFDLLKPGAVGMGDIQRRGDETVRQALAWMDGQAGRRFFAWIHLYDPHSPYEAPEPYASSYAGRPYAGEIAWTDALVGQVVDALEARGLLDRTMLVVTADHGESLGEHDESGHAFFVYDATMHVPLIVTGPWPELEGRRIPQVVRTIDIMPTVLEMLGIPPGAPSGSGVSLVPLMAGGGATPLESLEAYSESFYARYHFGWSDLRSLRTSRYRFIEAPRPELYDLQADRSETDNLAGRLPLVVETMRERLARVEEEMGDAPAQDEPAPMDEETQKKLAALGYIGSTVDTTGKSSAELADPKDKIGIVNRMHEAREEALEGDFASAIRHLTGVIQDAPEVIDAYFRLGNAHFEQGNLEQALAMFRRTLELKPDHDWAVVNMANTFVEMGRLEEAILGYRRFLEKDPASDNIAYRLAETLLDAGRTAEARAMFRRVLELSPGRASAAVGLAAASLREGNLSACREEIERALALDPNVRHAHYNLALALEAEGNPAAAAAEYRKEIALHAHAWKARFNLGRLLGAAGDLAGQVRELESALEDRPEFVVARFFLAKALLDLGELDGARAEALRALEQDPDHYYAALGHYVLADVYSRQGRPDAAEEAARAGRRLEARGLSPPPS